MATHVKIIAVLYIMFGALASLGAFFSSLIFGVLGMFIGSQADQGAGVGAAMLGFVGITLMIVLLTIGALSIICGWGLWKLRPWARIMAIILGAISLPKIPIGTAFGIYVLVIMFRKETEALFVSSS